MSVIIISLMVIGLSDVIFDNRITTFSESKALVRGLRVQDITSKPMRGHKIWLKNRGCDRPRLHGETKAHVRRMNKCPGEHFFKSSFDPIRASVMEEL